MLKSAPTLRSRYAEYEESRYGRHWSAEEVMLGLFSDVGDLAKLVQGKAGIRPTNNLDDKIAHELADCLWAVLVLADCYEVDLETAFPAALTEITAHLDAE